jgi:very-short-patch-repair endonuclease
MRVDGTASNPPRNGEGDHAKHGGGGPRILQTPIKQVKRARKLRREMSLPEVLLWQVLRKKPEGLKFRRQFPIGMLTADFACLEHRLIIEVDGEGHSFGDQPMRDAARDAALHREGFRVMRIAARDVLKDMDAVLRWILATCSNVGPFHHDAARRGPPPRSEEELQ